MGKERDRTRRDEKRRDATRLNATKRNARSLARSLTFASLSRVKSVSYPLERDIIVSIIYNQAAIGSGQPLRVLLGRRAAKQRHASEPLIPASPIRLVFVFSQAA